MSILTDVTRALEEDIGNGDVSAGLLPDDLLVCAKIISREPMLVCGREWVECVFAEIDADVNLKWLVEEGSWQSSPVTLCEISGLARSILTAERTALNFLQTLSATATQTYYYLQKLKNSKTRLLDTRKTIPGLRHAQKYAVTCAGGVNHRMGLYDAFLIKENHIKACGSISSAIDLARKSHPDLLIEVEVESLVELAEAINKSPDRIMLDNFTIEMLEQAIEMNKSGVSDLEFSGNVDISNLEEIAKTNVDYVSVGKLTKSITAIDLSLLIVD
ncbi:MAG: carboxylating nicotinate-nucleotide diphosphorylase [Legionellaceae bacterium]|nr:carboxylating nicotinate-nucleotide diphosphorylase [Legionellaceae bacterium]